MNHNKPPLSKEPPILGTGPPTDEELDFYYTPLFSWDTVKDQVNSGDLGNLKRHGQLQKRYDLWLKELVEKYGSVEFYLVNVKLGWGPTVTRPSTPSSRANPTYTDSGGGTSGPLLGVPTPPPFTRPMTPNPEGDPPYFTAKMPPKYFKILRNDWPYSRRLQVPSNVRHFVFWTRVPIIHPDIVPGPIWKRIEQDGLWGFTGSDRHATYPVGVDQDPETMDMVRKAHEEVHEFVLDHWPASEWEAAWFVNPPRLQSIPGLAHGHVFARQKSPESSSE